MNTETQAKATDTLGRDLLEMMVLELKMLPKPWPKLSQNQQNDVIDRMRARVLDGIKTAVHMIASDGRAVADATLKKVVFKGGITAEFELSKSCPTRHQLADAEGKLCLIVVADAADYTGDMDGVKGESDQRTMDLGNEYDPNGDGKGMDDHDVVDAVVLSISDAPLEAEKHEHYEAGRQARRDGKSKDAAPLVRFELVAEWTQGWVDEDAEQAGEASSDATPTGGTDEAPTQPEERKSRRRGSVGGME